jgi:hypothetical protein
VSLTNGSHRVPGTLGRPGKPGHHVRLADAWREHPHVPPSVGCSRFDTGGRLGWGRLHCPYGWLPRQASGDQACAGLATDAPPTRRICCRRQRWREMPGTMSQAELVRVLGVTAGRAGSLDGGGRKHPAAGRG